MTDAAAPGIARFRLILWILVAVAAVAATAVFLLRPPSGPLAVTGTPFVLQSTAGGTFTEQDLVGKPSLVFFGYTHCPDVCPTTLAETVAWKEQLGISDDALRTIFVTVDPERDTLPVLKDYLGSFDPDVIGLVGDTQQTEAAKASFGVMSEKGEPDADGFYLVNHSANVLLIDRNGRFQSTIAYGEAADTAVAKIKRLMGG
ncbi:MAG TPA: SCO family protein [Alphaproteobacteria bacterium]|nr:SCO family protein [Alphaproteobacteria bacterium]